MLDYLLNHLVGRWAGRVGLWVLVGWGLSGPAAGQVVSPRILDSLRAVLRRPGLADTTRVQVLDELCFKYMRTDLNKARSYGLQALALARRIGSEEQELTVLNDLGAIVSQMGNAALGQRYFEQALALARKQGNWELAVMALDNMAAIASIEMNREQAIRLREQAKALGEAHGVKKTLRSQAIYYTNQATDYTALDSKRLALANHQRALALLRQEGLTPYLEATALENIGRTYKVLGRNDSAEWALVQAEQLARRVQDQATLGRVQLLRGDIALEEGRLADAQARAEDARRLMVALGDTVNYVRALNIGAQALGRRGQARAALDTLLRFVYLNGIMDSRERQQALDELQVRFNVRQQQDSIRQLTQQRQIQRLEVERQQVRARLWGVAAVALALALGVFGWLYGRLRRSQRALAAATQSKDRLYAIIAHDLRGPLIALQGVEQMVAYYHRRGQYEGILEVTGEIGRTAGRLMRLLDNLLHYAASQAGELAYKPESLEAAALLEEIRALYESAAGARQVTLEVDVPDAGLVVEADRTMALTVLRNLMHNALKVAPAGSRVVLACRRGGGGQVELTVTDEGPGLTAEQVRALLTPGAARPHISGSSGTGLGLPLVQQLTQRQGGRFGLDSRPGQGTTARVLLPAGERVGVVIN